MLQKQELQRQQNYIIKDNRKYSFTQHQNEWFVRFRTIHVFLKPA